MVELYGGDPIGSAALTEQGTYAVPSYAGQVLGASATRGFVDSLFLPSMRAAGAFAAETGIVGADEFGRPIQVEAEPPMDTDAVNAEFAIPGVLKFDKPTPRSVAQDLYEHKRNQILRQDIIDRREGGILTGGAARFVAEMAGGLADPFNLATGFIPVVSQARQAALIARAAGAAERAAERFAIGGAQGALGMAALQPLEFALSRREQEDYTMADALRSIALGTVLGGGLHAGIGALGDRAAARLNPVSRMLEEAGPDVRQGLLRSSLAQMVDGRPVNLEPLLDIADALRSREIARMTVRQGGREVDQALPGAFEDPLVLARRGELTAERAAQIRDDLQTLTPAEVARAKAQIGEHVDTKMWSVIADNVAKAEGSRQGAIDVVADQLRYLPASGQIRSASEREAAAVIGRAMQAEAARGGDVAGLIDAAMQARHGAEAAVPAEVAAQKQQLLDMHVAGTEALATRTPLVGEQLAAHERRTGGGAEPAPAAAEAGPTAEPGAGPSPRAPPGELEQAGRAKVRLATDDERALLTLFQDADATSVGHESWHLFTNELFADAQHPDAPPELIADAAALRRAVGAEEGTPLTREQQEALAGWGEQYLREGRAPVPELQSLFDRFRAWFINIYETIAGLGAPISDEVRGIYDRMIALDGRPPEPRGPLRTPVPDNRPFERAPAAGETGGPRASDTVAEINAQADELQRLQQSALGEKPLSAESRAEVEAATEGAAEAEARASALDQAAVCMMRG